MDRTDEDRLPNTGCHQGSFLKTGQGTEKYGTLQYTSYGTIKITSAYLVEGATKGVVKATEQFTVQYSK